MQNSKLQEVKFVRQNNTLITSTGYYHITINTWTAEICSDIGLSNDSSIGWDGSLHLDATTKNFRWVSNAAFTIDAWQRY